MRSALPGPLHYFYADGRAARIWPQTPPPAMQNLGMYGRRRRGMRGMVGPDSSMVEYTDGRETFIVEAIAKNAIAVTAPDGSQQVQAVVTAPSGSQQVVVQETKPARPKWPLLALAAGVAYAVS